MALPPGLSPKTVTLGIASFADGSLASGRATISLAVNVLHTPSNRPIFSSDITKQFVDGMVSFDLLPTDAPGLNRVDWSYTLRVEISGANVQPDVLHFLLPTAGPDTVDLDGLVTVPSSAGVPISVDVLSKADFAPSLLTELNNTASATSVALRAAFVPAQATQATQWSTSSDITTRKLAQSTPAAFGPLASFGWRPLVVDPGKTHQEVIGFGVALTGASAELIQTKLSKAQRDELLDELFNPTRGNISVVRISIGASDFDAVRYTYDDQPTGGSDPSLTAFSIAPDQQYRIETLRQILRINPRVRILAAPWSAPAWMKADPSTGMQGSSLLAANFATYAKYLVKFLQAYKTFGIDVWALTPQNEPNQVFSWPGMVMTAADQATFIGTHLGPALDTAGLTTRVLCYDDSWGFTGISFVDTIFSNAAAAPYVDGAAWHWYGGDPTAMRTLARKYPSKGHYMTEACGGTGGTVLTLDTAYKRLFVGSMRNDARTVVLWNIALDENNGPTNRAGFSEKILGVYMIPSDGSGTYTHDVSYYALTQSSRFVRPGAVRISSSSYDDGLISVAYLSPNGQVTVVAYNTTAAAITTVVVDARSSCGFPVTIPAGDAVTFTWQGVGIGSATPGIAAPTAPGLTASAGAGKVNLTITPPTTSAAPISGYTITRGTTSGQRTQLVSLPPDATSFTDRTAVPGTPYFYGATAASAGGISPTSTQASASAGPATVPVAPTLTAAPGNQQNVVTITTGDDGGSALTAIKLYRGTSAGVATTGTALVTLTAGGAYTDSGLNNGTAYYYKAVAVNAVGTSSPSNETTGTPFFNETRTATKPATTSQPALWLRSDTVVGTNGSPVATWQDSSGRGINATQFGAGAPTLVTGAINSLPALHFDKSIPQALLAPLSLPAENITIMAVFRYPTMSAAQFLLSGATSGGKVTGSPNIYVAANGQLTAQVQGISGNAATPAGGVVANAFAIGAVSYDTAGNSHAMKSSVNGGTLGSQTPAAFTATAAAGLGLGAVSPDTVTIDVAEVIVFSAALSDADRHAWTVYLGQVYGITVGAN